LVGAMFRTLLSSLIDRFFVNLNGCNFDVVRQVNIESFGIVNVIDQVKEVFRNKFN
jgi:hypothetical protein